MSLSQKVIRRLKLYRDRFTYEVQRPQLSPADVAARLDPEHGADPGAHGGYAATLRRHLAATPVPPSWPADDGDDGYAADVDWHLEPHFGVRWPRRFQESFSDIRRGSDLVLLWHKNKMMFLLDLAARYSSTGEEHHAASVYRAIDSWCRQNPFMIGKNWRSPMEAGTRLVVWSYALSMLRGAPLPGEATCARIVGSVLRHADFLAGHFSHREVPNNHLIGEAATLYVFATYWPMFRDAAEWKARAEDVITAEVQRQVLEDGFDYENSVNYHLYVIDFLLLYLHAKAVRGNTPPATVTGAAERMVDAALALLSPGGRFPQIGDDSMSEFIALRPLDEVARGDDGSVRALDLMRPGFAAVLEETPWGRGLARREVELNVVRYFAGAGIAALRNKRSHVTFVCGPQHRRPFSPGHLHLDSGSFELEVDDVPVFVDSGTYLYTYDLAARRHFKGASAHNTVLVDGREPVECDEVFGWDEIHIGRTLGLQYFDGATLVGCERDLPGAEDTRFVHRRRFVEVTGEIGLWLVADTVSSVASAGDAHQASVFFHTALPSTAVTQSGARKLSLRLPGRAREVYVEVYSNVDHTVELIDDPDDMRCWYSRRYGDLCKGVTIHTRVPIERACDIVHVIRRHDVSVSFDGWDDDGVALTVMSDGPTRTIALDPRTSALIIDGQRVIP